MCFTGKNVLKTAKKDIVCYKTMTRRGISWFTDFQYTKNLLNKKVEFDATFYYDQVSINIGYHSYKSFKIAADDAHSYLTVFKFIIPKGTKYYENDTQYVSETIILKKRLSFRTFFDTFRIR